MANPQTAVLSPFSVPVYVLGFRWGYLVADILKILAGYLGMVVLSRFFGAKLVAQSVGAAAYVLSGYFVVWFYWPLSAVMSLLPGVMWLFLRNELSDPVRSVGGTSGRDLRGRVDGPPETAAFFVPFMLVIVAVCSDARRRLATLLIAVRNTVIGLLGAAVQIFPFAVYLQQSAVYAGPHVSHSTLESTDYVMSSFVPHGLGRPTGQVATLLARQSNFNELLGSYDVLPSAGIAEGAPNCSHHCLTGPRRPFDREPVGPVLQKTGVRNLLPAGALRLLRPLTGD